MKKHLGAFQIVSLFGTPCTFKGSQVGNIFMTQFLLSIEQITGE